MAQKKAHEVEAWLARRDPAMPIVLLYGPDRGLVSERAAKVAKSTSLSLDDPFSVVRLDAAELEQTPGRLLDEANTVPMFADRRLIWIRNAGAQKALSDEVKRLAAEPPADAIVLIEAGDLKKGQPLRTAVEAAATAMALPCYADESRSIDELIDQELQKAGLTITLEARTALKRSLGGDRLASRSELEKLALYAAGERQVTLEHVRELSGDVSALSMDGIVDSVLDGRPDMLDAAFTKLAASGGQAANAALSAVLRQFQALQLMRHAMEADGKTAGAVVASARPPIFFSRRNIVESALQRWESGDLSRAVGSIQNAVLECRRRADLAEAIARHILLVLATEASRRRR